MKGILKTDKHVVTSDEFSFGYNFLKIAILFTISPTKAV